MKPYKCLTKSLLTILLTFALLFSFASCGETTLEFGSPLDDLTEGSTSLVFVDDDRVEEDGNNLTSDRYQTDHQEQIETPEANNNNGNTNNDSTGSSSKPISTNNNNDNANTNNGGVGKGVATPVKLSEIPAYSGSPYYVINNAIPNFSAAELTTKSYEKYTPLDSLGRVGVAIASLSLDTMPGAGDNKDDYTKVKPTGWKQAQYKGTVPSAYLYHRCHMIAYSLCAEDETKTNLMTGTQYFNIKGMSPIETQVRAYIKETGNHVAYRVTPIFSGNNLLAHGIQLEAYSVEDKGEGICYNIFIYNVQPGVTLNYATGASSLS